MTGKFINNYIVPAHAGPDFGPRRRRRPCFTAFRPKKCRQDVGTHFCGQVLLLPYLHLSDGAEKKNQSFGPRRLTWSNRHDRSFGRNGKRWEFKHRWQVMTTSWPHRLRAIRGEAEVILRDRSLKLNLEVTVQYWHKHACKIVGLYLININIIYIYW